MSSGLIISIHLNKMGDIEKISYDKYLVGKLLDYITDIVFTSKVIVVTYLESRVTLITFGKPLDFNQDHESIAQAEPKISMLDLLGKMTLFIAILLLLIKCQACMGKCVYKCLVVELPERAFLAKKCGNSALFP